MALSVAAPTAGTLQIIGAVVIGTLDGSGNFVQYVGSSYKSPVRVTTTGAGTLATSFANGQTVDGIVLVTGDRILIKNQASAPTNGIYTVNASGAPTRATDFNEWSEIPGSVVGVLVGTTNADTAWVCTSDSGGTLGVTAINFSAFGSSTDLHSPGPIGDVTPSTIAGTTLQIDTNHLNFLGTGISYLRGVELHIENAGGTTGVILVPSAAHTLALRNAANGQTFLIGGTYTDGSNYVQGSIAATSTTFIISALTAGTGADNIDIGLTPAGTGVLAVGNAASADVLVASTHTALIKFNGVSYKILLATP